MLVVKEYITKKSYPTNYDYLFTKYEDFLELYIYMLPKIEGTLKIVFNQITLEEALIISKEDEEFKFLDFELFLRKDVIDRYYVYHPTKNRLNLSQWDLYMEMISKFPKTIETSASKELYKRAKGDTSKISDILEILEQIEESVITIQHINNFLQKADTVYPRDIFLSSLVKAKPSLINEMKFLFIYKRKNPIELLRLCEQEMNYTHIFYSLRKRAKGLFTDKSKWLQGKDISDKTNQQLVRNLDSDFIIRIYTLFLFSNPDNLYRIVEDLTSSELNLEYYKDCYLNNG